MRAYAQVLAGNDPAFGLFEAMGFIPQNWVRYVDGRNL